jgi:2-keto-4-pentenoate hydratase
LRKTLGLPAKSHAVAHRAVRKTVTFHMINHDLPVGMKKGLTTKETQPRSKVRDFVDETK